MRQLRKLVLHLNENRYTIRLYSMDAKLTKPQESILRFLEDRIQNGEPPPTYREISGHCGYKSPKAAADHVAALKKKGFVTIEKRCARGIRLVQKSIGIPVLGNIAAGLPSEGLVVSSERLALDPTFYGIHDRSRAFALRVTGDSMVGRQIADGDIVLLEHEIVPRNGDVVAALIDNASTLKTFVRGSGKVWLRAENPLYPDLIPASDLQVQGVGRAVIRFLSK
jgi:repressor LexA